MSNWLHKQVSLYKTHADNVGAPATFREVLLCDFSRGLEPIIALRALDKSAATYDIDKLNLKKKLQCYTPAALLATKAKGELKEISRTGVMQLDFDHKDIYEYDIEELKQAVFSLPSVAFCGLSCSGDGFYALVMIAEPDRLSDYAEHCFEYFKKYGVKPDESKGKKVENLRYLSYDCNMLIRETPEVLQIKNFKKKQAPHQSMKRNRHHTSMVPITNLSGLQSNNGLLKMAKTTIEQVQKGERWATVQRAAFTMGGINEPGHLDELITSIYSNSAFNGQAEKYIKCAQDCFRAGSGKPLIPLSK